MRFPGFKFRIGKRIKYKRPFKETQVSNLILKAELLSCGVLRSSLKKVSGVLDRIKQASRLEKYISRIQTLKPKSKSLVTVRPWGDLQQSKVSDVREIKGIVNRVKSELFKVTETCTAATITAPASNNINNKPIPSQKVIMKRTKENFVRKIEIVKYLFAYFNK